MFKGHSRWLEGELGGLLSVPLPKAALMEQEEPCPPPTALLHRLGRRESGSSEED